MYQRLSKVTSNVIFEELIINCQIYFLNFFIFNCLTSHINFLIFNCLMTSSFCFLKKISFTSRRDWLFMDVRP